MSRQKKNGKKPDTNKILLLTAIFQLAVALIELIKELTS